MSYEASTFMYAMAVSIFAIGTPLLLCSQRKHGQNMFNPPQTFYQLISPVLRIRIRIHRIHMFLGLTDPDPLVRGMDPDPDPALDPDPDPSIIMQK
jgi:hypothetical protein